MRTKPLGKNTTIVTTKKMEEAKSADSRKYPKKIYQAYNDYFGSKMTPDQIDKESDVETVATMALAGGKKAFDNLMKAHTAVNENFDGLNESAKEAKILESVINSITESINWIANRQTTIKESDEDFIDGEDEKLWWSSGSGLIEISMTLEQAESVSVGGQDATPAVDELIEDPEIAEQLSNIDDETLRKELAEYGAWDDEELEVKSDNQKRLLWIAANDLVEEAFSNQNESINESGSLDQALQYMNQLIAQGVEYPTAHEKAIMKFDVDGDDLADLYDNQDLQESTINESDDSEPWNMKDVVDSRDVESIIQELSSSGESSEELAMLQGIKSEVVDFLGEEEWDSGIQLIRYSYFEDYIESEAKEIDSEFFNTKNGGFPYASYIDWKRVARDIEINDYTSLEIDGVEYKFRSH